MRAINLVGDPATLSFGPEIVEFNRSHSDPTEQLYLHDLLDVVHRSTRGVPLAERVVRPTEEAQQHWEQILKQLKINKRLRDGSAARGEPQPKMPVRDGFPCPEARVNTARAQVLAAKSAACEAQRQAAEAERSAEEAWRAAELAKPIRERNSRFLTDEQKRSIEVLGFTPEGWNADDEPGWANTPSWRRMRRWQREAASELGFDEQSWWGPPPWD